MYLIDKLPDYENYTKDTKDTKYIKDIKDTNQSKSETLQLLHALTFLCIICFGIYNTISFLKVQIEYNNMIIYNENNKNNDIKIYFKKVSYNPIIFLLIIDMLLNMTYFVFTNILIHKNITGARYYTYSYIICIIIIIGLLYIIHLNTLNKISEYMNSIIMFDSANYYNLMKHIRISSILYIISYVINITTVILLV
jgi:hypothetical protein